MKIQTLNNTISAEQKGLLSCALGRHCYEEPHPTQLNVLICKYCKRYGLQYLKGYRRVWKYYVFDAYLRKIYTYNAIIAQKICGVYHLNLPIEKHYEYNKDNNLREIDIIIGTGLSRTLQYYKSLRTNSERWWDADKERFTDIKPPDWEYTYLEPHFNDPELDFQHLEFLNKVF